MGPAARQQRFPHGLVGHRPADRRDDRRPDLAVSEMKPKKILMVAGEVSGDLHGAHLMEAIQRIDPEIQFSGV